MALSAERAPGAESGTGSRERPVLLVAIPALNEERTVAEIIRGIPHEIPGVASCEVLVVDDGSSDRTAEEAARAGARVIRHEETRGVGAAFGTALRECVERGADLFVCIDADGQFDPADILKLVKPVLAGEVDFTSASRFADPSLTPEMPPMKLWGNRMMARLVSRLTGENFHDVSCGMRCYSRRAALSLNPMGSFTYTQEVFLTLAFKQLRIAEVPVKVRGEREYGESRVAHSLWKYAFHTSGIILRCYRDYQPMRLFGTIAAVLLLVAGALGTFLMLHYVSSGSFSPHKWAGFSATALFLLALLSLSIGLIGDMLNRHRTYLEELLYRQRAGSIENGRGD